MPQNETSTLVSVIIPCFNAERWLADCVTSVLEQDYAPLEVIIVDDGSTDSSAVVAQQLSSQNPDRVRHLRQVNRGAPAARNVGLSHSRGELVQWLDADDLLAPGKLSRQTALLAAPDLDVVVGAWQSLAERRDGGWDLGPVRRPRVTRDTACSVLAEEGWAPPAAYLMTRQAATAGSLWCESLTSMQDVDYVFRIAANGARFRCAPDLSAIYRRPLAPTVSTRSHADFMVNWFTVYERAFTHFEDTGWTDERRETMVRCYGWAARYFFEHDRVKFNRCVQRIDQLVPRYVPAGRRSLRWLSRIIGYEQAEHVALSYRQAKQRFWLR
jgi:glycosyltransferase involved in cell wall biosynthesis